MEVNLPPYNIIFILFMEESLTKAKVPRTHESHHKFSL